MDAAHNPQQPVCAQEALDLLNCLTRSAYDQEKCIALLQSLHECVLSKKGRKFSLAEATGEKADSTTEKQS
ncbi:Hypothetical predicted protein [Olea europaea subsp. europaea]|uniref:CHCH domain-containing protein n=1 Tax=Olea europaea subsp. europaea TaxID=158383 RepID=A0A8S0RF07_OLEEU|nr:Hypothetical predicted protein [Olea europaea subsp. europaea]